MSKRALYTGIGSAAVVVLATAGLTSANFGGLIDDDTREQLKQAEEDGDYATWANIQDSIPEITDYIDSEADFEKFIEMNEAYKSGDTEAGDALRDELGLPEEFRGGGKGGPGGQGQGGQKGPSEEERAALESGDYNAWLEATPEDSPIREVIDSEEDFQKFIEMHEARESGDDDTAKAIAEELGLPEKGGPEGEDGERGQGGPRGQRGQDNGEQVENNA